jgi:hypothetical protein
LFYIFSILWKLTKGHIEKSNAAKGTFVSTFIGFLSILILTTIWQDLAGLEFRTGIKLLILEILFSSFVAALFTFSLWSWKQRP